MSCTTSARPIYQPIDHQHIKKLHVQKVIWAMKSRPTYLIIFVTILVLIDYYVPIVADLIDINFHETQTIHWQILFAKRWYDWKNRLKTCPDTRCQNLPFDLQYSTTSHHRQTTFFTYSISIKSKICNIQVKVKVFFEDHLWTHLKMHSREKSHKCNSVTLNPLWFWQFCWL